MKKSSICIIGVYFGKLPPYMNLWLKSCEHNPDIDFLVFSDDEIQNSPPNVRNIHMTLPELKALADKKLGLDTALNKPYKCCDFKVVYGLVFERYIEEYDFWGYCDFDMVFGDLSYFFSETLLKKNDKLLPLGHLSIYRNTNEVNNRYKLSGSKVDYRKVFTSEKSYCFDEWPGIYRIYSYNHLPMYTERVFADISRRFTRFRHSRDIADHMHQVFYWENGKCYRCYYRFGKPHIDEYIYIHFQKRDFKNTITQETNAFYIGSQGFTVKTEQGVPNIDSVKRVNPFKIGQDLKEWLKYDLKHYAVYKYKKMTDKYLR